MASNLQTVPVPPARDGLALMAVAGAAGSDEAALKKLLAGVAERFRLSFAGVYQAEGGNWILRAEAGIPAYNAEAVAGPRGGYSLRVTAGAVLSPEARAELELFAVAICEAARALYGGSDSRRDPDLQKQLVEAQKMQAVGTLTAGIAHDFNNLLTTVLGQIELLRLRHGRALPEDALERLARVEKAGRRAAGLVSQLLAFSRHDPGQMAPVDVWAAVLGTVELLKHGLPENIQIHREARITGATVWGSLGQLQQALINMAANSLTAMPQGGVFRVTLDRAVAPPLGAEGDKQDWIVLTVSDTGVGMTEAVRERAFEPYFTTKPSTDSAGLGLAIVYGIVQAHRGRVEVESTPGVGTTFRVYLPLMRAGEAVAPQPSPVPRAGSESILLVEDDQAVAETTGQMLASLGYRVATALLPSEALRLMQQPDHRFDLMITDVTMPEMTGYQLADRMREKFGPMRVLFVTGYDFNASSGPASRFLLQKPLSLQVLGEGVRQALASEPA